MNSFSLGDLAQSFMLQRRGAALKADMNRASDELVTGRISDIKSVLAGNTSYLSEIEKDLKTLEGYGVSTTEAAQFTDAAQFALERVGITVESLSAMHLALAPNALGPVLDQFSEDAKAEMSAIVNALNTTAGGRSLFAGRATDQSALQDAGTILDGLRAATVGVTNTADLKQAAQLWFDDPNGFAAVAYNGSDDALAPVRVGKDETIDFNLTANDQTFQDLLMHISVAVISKDATFNFGDADRRELLQETGQSLFQAQADLTAVRASVGSSQARIDSVATRNATEENALLSAKNALLQVDPYEAATELEAVQFQLQSLYTVTARMSDLSFVNFIR
ncbi:flagellin [Tateyamaria armeniaca]|uniref:Flagellin n=1 Tax=Tateyamaria armeniaca TaxID=2518930 RepID=A0ABW8URD6_9RHOB